MGLPAGIFAHCIVRHPEFGFPFVNPLFPGPPDTAEPDQRAARDTGWRIAERIGRGWLGAAGPLDHQPDGALWQAVLTSGDAVTRKVLRHGPDRKSVV